MFNFDYNKFIKQMLPPFLRKPKTEAWLQSLVKPVNDLYDDFITYRRDTLDRIAFTGQELSLESLLNDRFDPVDRGIFIDTLSDILPKNHIYNKTDGADPIYIFNKADGDAETYTYSAIDYDSEFDFVVKVPSAISFSQAEMEGLVNTYRIAGMNFKIETY